MEGSWDTSAVYLGMLTSTILINDADSPGHVLLLLLLLLLLLAPAPTAPSELARGLLALTACSPLHVCANR